MTLILYGLYLLAEGSLLPQGDLIGGPRPGDPIRGAALVIRNADVSIWRSSPMGRKARGPLREVL